MTMDVLMRCGCTAQGVCHRMKGIKFDPPVPVCVVHDCIEIAETKPDLTGRSARCSYFGHGGFRNHGPIHGGGSCTRNKCECIVPSNYELPFFVYCADKETDTFFCGCAGWD